MHPKHGHVQSYVIDFFTSQRICNTKNARGTARRMLWAVDFASMSGDAENAGVENAKVGRMQQAWRPNGFSNRSRWSSISNRSVIPLATPVWIFASENFCGKSRSGKHVRKFKWLKSSVQSDIDTHSNIVNNTYDDNSTVAHTPADDVEDCYEICLTQCWICEGS